MRRSAVLSAVTGAAALSLTIGLTGFAGATTAGPTTGHHGGEVPVFVLTNDQSGNQVVSYRTDPTDGALTQVERVNTGGLGVAVPGAVVDRLASQGGLASDPADGLLVAVNGGSNTISVFHTFGTHLDGPRVVSSGGNTPVSVTVHGDAIYVLNIGGAGSIQGFFANSLRPIPGSNRSLGLTPGLQPPSSNSPAQVGFTPDGRHLVVTTKHNGSDIDVFNTTPWGGIVGNAVVNPSATPVPFGFTFDRAGLLVVTEAATNALTTYSVAANGILTELASTTNGEASLCWVTTNGTFFFGANAHDADVTTYRLGAGATPVVVANTATDPGPEDMAATPDGRFLYVETGGSDLVDSFAVQRDGSLVSTGSVAPELPGHIGLEGIALGSAW